MVDSRRCRMRFGSWILNRFEVIIDCVKNWCSDSFSYLDGMIISCKRGSAAVTSMDISPVASDRLKQWTVDNQVAT